MEEVNLQIQNMRMLGETRLPPELWLHVLLFLTTKELRVTASLSSFFYRLSLPILYECVEWNIGWRGLASASHSTRMLMAGTGDTGGGSDTWLLDRVKSCRISRKVEEKQTLDTLKKPKGSRHRHDRNTEEWLATATKRNHDTYQNAPIGDPKHDVPVTIIPFQSYASVIIRMKNLRRLCLTETLLPYDFIIQLPNLTNLKDLEIKSCDIESSYSYVKNDEESSSIPTTRSPSPASSHWDAPTFEPHSQPQLQVHINDVTGTNTTNITHLTLLGIQMSVEPPLFAAHVPSSHVRRYAGGIDYFYRTLISPSLVYIHTTTFELTNIKKVFEDLVPSDQSNTSTENTENTERLEQAHGPDETAEELFNALKHFCISCCIRAPGANDLLPFLWRFGQGITRLELSNKDESENNNLFRDWIEGHMSPLTQATTTAARRFLPNLTSYAGPSALLDVLYRGRELRDISIRDRLPKVGRSDWRTDDGETGSPAVENLLDALEGWGFTNNNNAQQAATVLVFGNASPNQTTNLQDLLSHWIANRTPQRSQLGRDALEIDMKKLEDTKVVREMAEYLGRTVQIALRHLGSKGVMLERLELTLVWWDVDLLWMVVNVMPSLKELEIKCFKQGPDEQFFMSFWGNFLHLLPNLQRLNIYDLSLPSVPSRSSIISAPDRSSQPTINVNEKQEAMSMQDQRQAILMISRLRPSFSEMSMTRAIVWKRLPHPTPIELETGKGWGYELRPGWENTPDDPLMPFLVERPKCANPNVSDRKDDFDRGDNNHHRKAHPSASRHAGGGKSRPSGGNESSVSQMGLEPGSRSELYAGWRDVMADDLEDDDEDEDDDDYEMTGLYDQESISENGDIDQSEHGGWNLGFLRRRGGIGQRIRPESRLISAHRSDPPSGEARPGFQPARSTQPAQRSPSPVLVPNSPELLPSTSGWKDDSTLNTSSIPHNPFIYAADNTISDGEMAFYASLQPDFNKISFDHNIQHGLHRNLQNTASHSAATALGLGQGRIRDIHTRSRSRSIHPLQLYPIESHVDSQNYTEHHLTNSLDNEYGSPPLSRPAQHPSTQSQSNHSFHPSYTSQPNQTFYLPYSPSYDSASLSASVSTPASSSAYHPFQALPGIQTARVIHTANQSTSSNRHGHNHHHREASDDLFDYKYGASPYEHRLYNQAYNESSDMELGGLFETGNTGGTASGHEGYETDYSFYDTSVLYRNSTGPGRSRAHSNSDSGVWAELGGLENLQINMMDAGDGMANQGQAVGVNVVEGNRTGDGFVTDTDMHIDHEEEDADFVDVGTQSFPRYMWD